MVEFPGGPPDGSKERPFLRNDSVALDLALQQMDTEFRFNLRAQRVEWRDLTEFGEDDWLEADRMAMANLRERIARRFFYWREVRGKLEPRPLKWGRDLFDDVVDALVYNVKVDPFQEWLMRLPPWDGVPRLNLLLMRLFDAPADELTQWASRYLVLACIQRTLEPGCKLDEIPVLIGPQGIGKSALLRAILPPEVPDLFGDGLNWDAPTQVKIEATLRRALVEVSEMAGRRRAEIEAIKTYIVQQDDGGVRLPYDRRPATLKRRFALCATTNNETDLPNDPTGNRRFVAIPMTINRGVHVEHAVAEVREDLWSEGLARYHEGERANLERNLMAFQRERAEEHRDRDDVLEDAIAGLHGDGPLKLASIIELIGEPARGATPHRVGRALKNAGWTQRRMRVAGKIERRWCAEGVNT